MERLKKINSILFTIMSSIIIIFALVMLILLIVDLSRSRYSRPNTDMISNEQVADNIKDNLRTQLISFENITLIDSAKSIYLLPVSQIKLENPEQLPMAKMEISVPASYSYYRGDELYNNLVVINLNDNSKDIIFKSRTCIVEYYIYRINLKKYLFMLVCTNDTNNDDVLNAKDLLELYIYDFDIKENIKLSQEPAHILDLDFIEKKNEVMVTFGIDHNDDKIFDRKYEPIIIKRIDLKSRKIIEILDQDISNKLQSILDGTVKN